MNKIHELFTKNNDDLLDNELGLSDDEKKRILDMTVNKISSCKNQKFSKKKLIVGILVATMMIGTVAMASEYFESNLDSRILNFLGINKTDISLDGAGVDVNKSITNNNLNLDVRQTLGDNNTIYVLIDVTAPSNVIIPENAHFNDSNISINNSKSAGWYFEDLKDEHPDDNKQSYLISYNTEKLLNGDTITLDFNDFGYYSEEKSDFITLVKGKWKISWNLEYKNLTKTFKVNQFLKDSNYKSFITSINISPISISANLIGKQSDNFYINGIIMKDGTTYKSDGNNLTGDNSIFISGSGSTSFLKSYTSNDFSKIVDVDEVKSVIIGNEIIDLE